MTTTEPLIFNPLDPAFRLDAPKALSWTGSSSSSRRYTGYVFSRYADCVAIVRDPRSSSDARNSDAYTQAVEQGIVDADEQVLNTPFLFLDPPDHTRLRGLVSRAFTPRVVEELRPRILELVDELLDAAAEKGSIEIIEDLAYPLPVDVICELLGVPSEDHVQFREWSRETARSLDPEEVLPPEVREKRVKTMEAFSQYFQDLIAERRKHPGQGLIDGLIATEEAGDKLSEEELLSTCILLLVAGHETTVNLIGNGMLALLRHPDQLELLRNDPSLTTGAVEELLRYDPPVQLTGRTALEDMEVGGATIKKGRQSVLLLAAANRDPERFENPDTLDITRADNRHLAFGFGIHACLGAPLARLEGEIAFRRLCDRFEGLQLITDAPEYKENIVLRGLASLPVSFTSAASG